MHHRFEQIHPTVNHFYNQYLARKYTNKYTRQWFIPTYVDISLHSVKSLVFKQGGHNFLVN